MATIRFAHTAAALILSGLGTLGTAQAFTAGAGLLDRTAHVTPTTSSHLRPVAMQAKSEQLSGQEVEQAAVATWKGNWTNDVSGGAGEVMIRIDRATGGTLSGTGEATGGRCPRTFDVSGWYRESLVQLDLALPATDDGCPAATVSISLRVGRRNEQLIGIGHWSNSVDGRGAGKAFGILELTRQ